jgi:DNA-binding transcriptional regulator YhcF (GntR family)
MAVSGNHLLDIGTPRRVHRRDYVYSLERGKRYTVLLRRLFSWLDSEEVMVLGYILSLANREHPSIQDMTTDLAMSSEVLKRALRSLKSKGVLFHDNLSVGDRQKPLWHISHPCRWSFSNVPFADSVDPSTHEPRTFSEHVPRINEAREFILAQSDTIRVPNLLFRVQIGWRPRFVWVWLSQLPHDVNPTISGLSKSLNLNWRTIRQALDTLDEVGMIAIEEHQRRKFGRAVCLYFHLTDVHNWKFKVAQDLYPAPKSRPSRGITRYSDEAGRQERWDYFKPMLQSFQVEDASEGVSPSNSSAFESRKLYFRSAESEGVLHSDSVFSVGMTVFQPWLTAFQPCMTAKTPSDTPLKPLVDNGSSSYNKAFIIKPIKESMEEDARGLPSTERGDLDLEGGRLPKARIISIADSVSHVFVSSRNRKCDPGLWTDAVAGIFKTGGESAARQFARYVADVYAARGNRPIAYNSLAIEDLSAAFLSGRSPSEIAAQETARQTESLTHALHSREKAPGGLDKVESVVDLGKATSTQTRANSERESPGCSEKENDRLRDVPSDPIGQRWLIHRIWPKLTKSQKSLLQDIWARFPVQDAAIRAFAAQDEDCCLKVISVSAQILQDAFLGEAPLLPWQAQASGCDSAPNFPLEASRKGVDRHVEDEQRSEFVSEVARSRLEAAIPILCRALKPATRLSMEKGYSRLSDGDLWRSLCGTFTEKRVRGVLSIIP